LARTIHIYTVYQQYFWQRNHQRRGHIWYINSIFGREITKGEVIYGDSAVFLAEKSPKARSYMVCRQYFWQRNHQRRGHIWCVNSIFGREITKDEVIYGVSTVFLAEKSPKRGHIWCVNSIFGREITKDEVIYGVYVRFWLTLQVRRACMSCPFEAVLRVAANRTITNIYIDAHTRLHTHTHTHTHAHTHRHTHTGTQTHRQTHRHSHRKCANKYTVHRTHSSRHTLTRCGCRPAAEAKPWSTRSC